MSRVARAQNAEGFGGLGFRGSHCHTLVSSPSGLGRLETFQVLMCGPSGQDVLGVLVY